MSNLKDLIINVAKKAVESHIKNTDETFDESDPYLDDKKSCFVCIKNNEVLRGCIGTLSPSCATLKEEIIKNAISAATSDYRFSPVTEPELKSLKYSVDVLMPLEKCEINKLDEKEYGVMVKSGTKVGVLLPNLEGVDNIAQQVAIAQEKAGIIKNEPFDIFRF